MSEPLVIQSHRGPYTVHFADEPFADLQEALPDGWHFIVDARVAELYRRELKRVLEAPSVLMIEATETAKSLEPLPGYVEHLVGRRVRRSHVLVAIGGGIIQDITSFLAATLLRGLSWHFYPTTLLAQADSCIGSKSSINAGGAKNVLGTFAPPARIGIATRVLATLAEVDVRSGIGEMLKAHANDGAAAFDRIAADYGRILRDPAVMAQYVRDSLEIKRRLIEVDEFDRGVRQLMNYGHSFGHAIESATDYTVPHGIAVTLGMDMANYVAVWLGRMAGEHYRRMHPTLARNYAGFEDIHIPLDRFFTALGKDKKNRDADLSLILPDADARLEPVTQRSDEEFRAVCAEYVARERRR